MNYFVALLLSSQRAISGCGWSFYKSLLITGLDRRAFCCGLSPSGDHSSNLSLNNCLESTPPSLRSRPWQRTVARLYSFNSCLHRMRIANWVECCKGYETWMNQDTVFSSDCRTLGIVGKSSFRAFWACFSRNEQIKTEEDIPFSFPYPNPYCSAARNQFIATSGN